MSKRYTCGKISGDPAIIGPGGPYLYARSEVKQMAKDCAEMNAEDEDERDGDDAWFSGEV